MQVEMALNFSLFPHKRKYLECFHAGSGFLSFYLFFQAPSADEFSMVKLEVEVCKCLLTVA